MVVQGTIWTVTIDTWGDGVGSIDDELIVELTPMLAEFGVFGVATSLGGLAGGPGATFSIEMEGGDVGAAAREAVSIFDRACEKLGVVHRGVARVEVMTEHYAELELDQPTETYLGVSELSSEIGVTRQRVSELRTRPDFPAPVAELAAGPVWASSSLRRFLATWERKPGRPLKVRNPKAERIRDRRTRFNDLSA